MREIFIFTLLTNTPYRYYNIPIGGIAMKKNKKNERKQTDAAERKKERAEEEKRALMNRLSRIEGQIRGIKGMVENDAYCPDILTQAAAVNNAVNAFTKALLTEHIRTCVAEDIRQGKDESIDELTALIQRLMK